MRVRSFVFVDSLLIKKELYQFSSWVLSQVMGAYFEKLGSKSFAVYSIAVTDANNRTWFVKRRSLPDIP